MARLQAACMHAPAPSSTGLSVLLLLRSHGASEATRRHLLRDGDVLDVLGLDGRARKHLQHMQAVRGSRRDVWVLARSPTMHISGRNGLVDAVIRPTFVKSKGCLDATVLATYLLLRR